MNEKLQKLVGQIVDVSFETANMKLNGFTRGILTGANEQGMHRVQADVTIDGGIPATLVFHQDMIHGVIGRYVFLRALEPNND